MWMPGTQHWSNGDEKSDGSRSVPSRWDRPGARTAARTAKEKQAIRIYDGCPFGAAVNKGPQMGKVPFVKYCLSTGLPKGLVN